MPGPRWPIVRRVSEDTRRKDPTLNPLRSRYALWFVVLLVFGTASSFAQSPEQDRIIGAWDYKALAFCDATSCDTGMFSFNAGGTVVGYDNISGVSPSIGTWRKTNPLTYRVRTKNAIFSPDGSLKFYILSAGTLKLSSDARSFDFQGTVTVLDPDGAVRSKFPGPISGTRF